ncbi:hypothetical protein J4219_02145 [Candidatus Woesearchaeota archaeon]|nr:hypothetical protein [Candidatus Woesearchaeota archaeon]
MKKALIFLLLLSSLALASPIQKDSILLLAMIENGTGQSGGVARLDLEIHDGKERVFLETYPMTKVTTQASLRFAQQTACKELDVDCSDKDFLFTIQALPGIVGGPSAGSAATFITSALLLNKSVPDDVAMTGTINSGGLIGPVGGLRFKIEAAAEHGIKRAYIPKGTKDSKEGNKTIDLIEYGKQLNVTVMEVATIGEVLELELGVPRVRFNESLKIDEKYAMTMRDVAQDLCERSQSYSKKARNDTKAQEYSARAKKAFEQGEFYAAASYCFRSNVEYKQNIEYNVSNAELEKQIYELVVEAQRVKKNVESKNITTLTDLQTAMAVLERVDEALELLFDANESKSKARSTAARDVAYAEERLFSGVTWSRFFDGSSQQLIIDEKSLEKGCVSKISEAEERYNYVRSVIPDALDGTRADIDDAYALLRENKHSMCLYTASKAKAEADVVLGVMGVEEDRFGELISLKLDVSKEALMKAQKKGVFPIIAYSYYEYASSLQEFDNVSSLLFAEYALELSNLDIYFEKRQAEQVKIEKRVVVRIPSATLAFAAGMIIGVVIAYSIFRLLSGNREKTLQAPPKRRLRGKKR